MSKFLTVGELKQILAKHDDSLIPVFLQDGNGHYTPLEKKYIQVEKSVYFPDSDIDFPENINFLRLGII
jgi:hypothetical protein